MHGKPSDNFKNGTPPEKVLHWISVFAWAKEFVYFPFPNFLIWEFHDFGGVVISKMFYNDWKGRKYLSVFVKDFKLHPHHVISANHYLFLRILEFFIIHILFPSTTVSYVFYLFQIVWDTYLVTLTNVFVTRTTNLWEIILCKKRKFLVIKKRGLWDDSI